MSLGRAEVPHVARAALRAVTTGVGEDDGAVVGVADAASIRPACGVAADPQAKRIKAMHPNARACLRENIASPPRRTAI